MFDVQVKRLHEYKRQHLNVLHILARYLRLKRQPDLEVVPRTFIFAGKAAPGYVLAKLIIKFITATADLINHDKDVDGRYKVVFLPNYRVSLAEKIFPASDLSEQISTAGKEASGTGNMKFSMNGALTIGTLDGANIEIRDAVGADNFFLFGLQAEEVADLNQEGYDPMDPVRQNPELAAVLELIASGALSPGEPDLFRPLLNNLMGGDPYLVLRDFEAYVHCQEEVDQVYLDPQEWSRRVALNIANMGPFSSDRTIREYARDIWNVKPVPVKL
jgi:starch phosphorylase